MSTINGSYEASLTIDEVMKIFELKPSKDGNLKLDKLSRGPSILVRSLNFTYPNSSKRVINNLNLNIKSGEKIAIVGHNGAGKTTLIKLLLRFYNDFDGEILVNKANLKHLKISSWYRNIGVLFQEYNTYSNLTLLENVTLGKPVTINNKLILNSLKAAQAKSLVKEYENGLDQILSEKYKGGIRPSTGQWQKIAIARFFYRNAPLVIFDEPTAAIDAVSEKKIFDRIYRFFKGKTVIIISHRFSTVRNADRIIVFENGKIAEQGSHEELIKLGGVYKKSFDLQAEGYK